MRRLVAAVLVAVLASCGAPPAPPARVRVAPREDPAPPPPARDDGRLPSTAQPLSYSLALDVDPRAERFRGVTLVRITARERTFHVVVHARGLRVTRATAILEGAEVPLTATPRLAHGGQTPEELVLTLPRALDAGAHAELRIAYDAPFSDGLEGLYRVQDGGGWYAFTQFEPTAARRMFPCFDEPGFKVPFEVEITVPAGMIAIGNAPEAARAPAQGTDGATTFRFAATEPLPTYLVALAVGDFDVRAFGDAPGDPPESAPGNALGGGARSVVSPFPIRLIAPKGKAALGGLALDATAALARTLTDDLDVPYPFRKLDVVAAPQLAPGAMENAGLVTVREEYLLIDPRRASVQARRNMARILAHELAHQWFGDLVTPEWWNDVWLNEALATWMETRAVDAWRPRFGARLEAVSAAQGAMDTDGLTTARAVRQAVRSTGEALEAFDEITYEKGAALLAMTEGWLGAGVFRSAMREYLTANAFKNAKADSLLQTLDRVSRKDVTQMATGFLDHAGVPMVTAHLSCEPGSRWNVELREEPWRPLGSTAEPTHEGWTMPICVLADGRKDALCTVMFAGAPSIVAGRGACPAWVHPNARSAGYFRFAESPNEFLALARGYDRLDAASRLGLVSNMWAMIRAGALGPEVAVKVLPLFDREGDRAVLEELVAVLRRASDALVEDDARSAFQAFVAARLGRHKKALAWGDAGEAGALQDDDRALLRGTIMAAMADLAGDAATLAEAEPLAQSWLKGPASVDPDVAKVAVALASRRAGAGRLDALRAAAKSARTPQDRLIALGGMFEFDDPAVLERALDVALTGEVTPAEMTYVLRIARARHATQPALARRVEAWVEARWEPLRAKLSGGLCAVLFDGAWMGCSRAEVDAARAFYEPRVKEIEGAARPLAEALERATLCAELHARGARAFSGALRRR